MSRNLRQYARQTNVRLLIGFGLILLIIGDSLIYFIYGSEAAILGFICLLAGLFPLVLIGLVLRLMEKVLDRAQ
jgi:energy-converting hydrogenase Eha subunit E